MMLKKKMMLVAGMALAVAAFAVPASASAAGYHWTDDHEVVGNDVDIVAPFEGFLDFTIAPPFVPVHSTFGCQVTVEVTVQGPTAAEISKYAPTTTQCTGTGIFTGCQLQTDQDNIPWTITNTDVGGKPVLDITKTTPTSGDITIRSTYHSCAAGALPASHLEYLEITATPTLGANGTITSISIEGNATITNMATTGTLTPEDDVTTLGLTTVN